MGTVTFKTQDQLALERLADRRASAKVSPFQLRVALARSGKMGQVRSMMGGRDKDSEVALAWEYATEIRRGSNLVAVLTAELGMTEDELDDLFALAETIEA